MDTVLPTLALIVMQLVTSGAGLVFAVVLALLRRAPPTPPIAEVTPALHAAEPDDTQRRLVALARDVAHVRDRLDQLVAALSPPLPGTPVATTQLPQVVHAPTQPTVASSSGGTPPRAPSSVPAAAPEGAAPCT